MSPRPPGASTDVIHETTTRVPRDSRPHTNGDGTGAAAGPSAAHHHVVHFYESDARLASVVARFLAEGVRAGDGVVVIATAEHARAIRAALEVEGLSDPAARWIDAQAALAEFMHEGAPDAERFESTVGSVIAEKASAGRLRAYGEMVDVLWRGGQQRAALQVEEMWNGLQRRHGFQLFCAYSMGNFYKEPASLESVLARHTHVSLEDAGGSTSASEVTAPSYAERLAADIAHREEVERSLRNSIQELRTREERLQQHADLIRSTPSRHGGEPGAAQTEKLLRITAAIANAVTGPEVYCALVDDVADALGASSAGLWLLDEDGRTARLVRSRGYAPPSESALAVLSLALSPAMPVLDCIRSGDPVWFPSQADLLERYPHLAPMTTGGRRYRGAALPLFSDGRVLGALGLTVEEAVPAAEGERDFLRLVALYASQAVERLRLLEAERRSREEAHALYGEMSEARTRAEQLYRFAQVVVAADRVEIVFDSALEAIQNALGARRSAILTYDDEGVMRFRAWRQLSDDYRRAVEGHSPWTPDDPAPRPVLVSDALGDPSLAGYRALFQSEGIGALAFIPLVSRGRLLGKFMVYHDHAREFAPHEIETAQAIGNHLGSVMTRFAAIARLEETIRSNELFAGALAHDLRNPLGAIMTAAQVALMQREGQDQRGARDPRPLSRILSSGHRMANMIDQLLDFTRVRSGGGIPIEPHEANLADLCTQAIGELELGHPEWIVKRHSSGDLSGAWDANRLLQVISNLVANAGQHGTPQAPIYVHTGGTAADQVTLEVHNQGVIPEIILPHLFDPFRGTRYRGEQTQGLGLGLYIVREIVRAHGGTVSVHSNAAEGTTFRVGLPRASARRRLAEGHAAGSPLAAL